MNKWFAVGLFLAATFGAVPAKANLLSSDDQQLYHQAFEAARNDHYDWAMAAAAKADNKLLTKVLQWQNYIQPNSGAAFADITAFIQANPAWPQPSVLMRRAEEALTPTTPDTEVAEWFAGHAPLTVEGAMAYGRVLIAAGQTEKAEKILRTAWIGDSFGPLQEAQFLAGFQEILRNEDQVARLDRLLWEHQAAAAAHQMERVDEAYRGLAQARLALLNEAANADTLVAAVPDAYKNDPGLIYELMRYRRQHDDDDGAIQLLAHPAVGKTHPDLWWTERAILARRALQQGRAAIAYDLARNHTQTSGANFAEAEWLAGWIALRFAGDHEAALAHFARMFDHVATPQSRSRAAYWAGRAADELGQGDGAVRWYNLAASYGTTFYGQLAAGRLNLDQPFPTDPQPTAEDVDHFDRHELVEVARMLGEIKETELLRPFLLRLNELAASPGERVLTADLATSLGRADVAVNVAKRSERDGAPLIAFGYPIIPGVTGEKPERPLVLGLIRQESAFYFEAVSPVGARGLMQLMPATATKVAKGLNVAFKTKEALADALTRDPALNVKLGSAYLNDLIADFNGSYILSVAAYNAGPQRVKKWIHDYGDPRQTEVDPIDWIESIPYTETRNYVQRVLEGVQIYRRRLGATDLVLSLESDIKRKD